MCHIASISIERCAIRVNNHTFLVYGLSKISNLALAFSRTPHVIP
jgi:hypothetical protein